MSGIIRLPILRGSNNAKIYGKIWRISRFYLVHCLVIHHPCMSKVSTSISWGNVVKRWVWDALLHLRRLKLPGTNWGWNTSGFHGVNHWVPRMGLGNLWKKWHGWAESVTVNCEPESHLCVFSWVRTKYLELDEQLAASNLYVRKQHWQKLVFDMEEQSWSLWWFRREKTFFVVEGIWKAMTQHWSSVDFLAPKFKSLKKKRLHCAFDNRRREQWHLVTSHLL